MFLVLDRTGTASRVTATAKALRGRPTPRADVTARVTRAPLARIARIEVGMQAVMNRVALMRDGGTDVRAAHASRADGAMERYACGDDEAFVDVYDAVAPRLYAFALRWTRSRAAAEDTVQQTLLQIHAARHRFVQGSPVVPWAYAIARRLLIDLGRRGAREELRAEEVHDPEAPAPAPSPEEALDRRQAEEEGRRELASLPAGWRAAFELVKFEGLSVADAAEVLGITRGMVKARTHRATAALRKAMGRRSRDTFEPGGATP
jgi:RNA polymerase sigma-70 factor (ECF subfamily)